MPLNDRFDWLISDHQNVNPSTEAILILSGKIQRIYVCPSYDWAVSIFKFRIKGAQHKRASLTLALNQRAIC